jgi:hypothetical protein
MPLPNDFRALGKAPMPPPGQGGSPMQISGNKLQENFEYLDKKEAFPIGKLGDMLYHDGTDWKRLPSPSNSGVFVLSHNGTVPSWIATEECA